MARSSASGVAMRRREVITLLGGVAAAWPFAARAQQSDRVRRIGWLVGAADDAYSRALSQAFRQGLQQLGWIDGRNVQIDVRFGAGGFRSNPQICDGTGRAFPGRHSGFWRQCHTASASGKPARFAIVADPVGSGYVESLSRPGGNASGFMQFDNSLSGKWLELLKQIAPNVTRVAVLWDPTVASAIGQFAVIQSVAPSLGVDVR